jgi:excisionase family DNA binding protein
VNLVEQLEARNGAMKVSELSELLGVDDKHVYRMAARGRLPSFHVGVLSVLIPKKLLTGSARNMEQKLASTSGRHVALHRSRAKHRPTHECQSKGGGQPSNSSRMKGGESCKTAEVGPVERKDLGDPMDVH